jgi:hypothetical protein
MEYSVEAYLKVLDALLSNNTQKAIDTLDTHLKRTHEEIVALVKGQFPEVTSLAC